MAGDCGSVAVADRLKIHRIVETNLGVTPATPTFIPYRKTSDSLNFNINNIQSEETRADAQIADLVQVGADASGDLNFELSYEAFDAEIAAAVRGTWGTPLAISASDLSAASSDNSFNSVGGDFTPIIAGQWVKVSGFLTNPANNGYFRVVTPTSTKIIVAAGTLVDESAGDTVAMVGTGIVNSVDCHSFTVQKLYDDLSPKVYHTFPGVRPGGLTLNFESGSILNGTIPMQGLGSTVMDNAGVASQTITANPAANNHPVMNAVSNVVNIYMDNAAMTTYFKTLTAEVDNGLRPQDAIGYLGPFNIAYGTMDIKGSINLYFQNKDMYEKFRNATSFSLAFRLQDTAGNSYIITMCKVLFQVGNLPSGGRNTDIMLDAEWQGVRDPLTDVTMRVDKFAA